MKSVSFFKVRDLAPWRIRLPLYINFLKLSRRQRKNPLGEKSIFREWTTSKRFGGKLDNSPYRPFHPVVLYHCTLRYIGKCTITALPHRRWRSKEYKESCATNSLKIKYWHSPQKRKIEWKKSTSCECIILHKLIGIFLKDQMRIK